ncbi:MAG: hypothetical protein AAGH99_04875 [Planctomycetota bacterium]
MLKFRTGWLIVVTALFSGHSVAQSVTTIEYEFAGVFDDSGVLPEIVSDTAGPGSPFTGRIVLGPDLTNLSFGTTSFGGPDENNEIAAASSMSSIEVTVGGVTFRIGGPADFGNGMFSESIFLFANNDQVPFFFDATVPSDTLTFAADTGGAPSELATPEGFATTNLSIDFIDTTATVFKAPGELPADISLADFDSGTLRFFGFFVDPTDDSASSTNPFFIDGQLTSFGLVPEPGTLFGLIALTPLLTRRRVSKHPSTQR